MSAKTQAGCPSSCAVSGTAGERREDPLSELLGPCREEEGADVEALDGIIRLFGHSACVVSPPSGTRPEDGGPAGGSTVPRKRKATHYLEAEVAEALNAARAVLAEALGRTSKSEIVNRALSLALGELEKSGDKSRLVRAIRKGRASSRAGRQGGCRA